MLPPAIKLAPAAALDLDAARSWYFHRSTAAAARFIAAFDAGVSVIAAHPERWPTYTQGTRRYRLNRFPYLIVYRVAAVQIEIIACQHAHRRPDYWRARL